MPLDSNLNPQRDNYFLQFFESLNNDKLYKEFSIIGETQNNMKKDHMDIVFNQEKKENNFLKNLA